ncbi:MAG: sucrase ferredoxin [Synechococcales bacterium]|nr:sucrase ferredoxin [Synechococcales bacterium]
MSHPELIQLPAEACRFCSVVSKENGEDPIGSAWPYVQWLIIEMPQPWDEDLWVQHPIAQPIFDYIKALRENHGIWTRPLVIAPDRDYSVPGHTRILYYRRPAQLFSQLEKQEFLVPPEKVLEVAIALLHQSTTPSGSLAELDAYHQPGATRDLMVCTHGNVDVACARFGYPIYEQLRNQYATSPIPSTHPSIHSPNPLRIWRCSHFGGHNFAPTLVDLPTGQYWGHLESSILDTLIYRRGSVADLRPFYRGWSGLRPFEQMVEREIWIERGWEWLNYLKSGTTIAIDPTHEDEWDADWGTVQIDFQSPDGQVSGRYEAKVETRGSVMTQYNSGTDQSLESVKQYQVTSLIQVAR